MSTITYIIDLKLFAINEVNLERFLWLYQPLIVILKLQVKLNLESLRVCQISQYFSNITRSVFSIVTGHGNYIAQTVRNR